MPIYDQIFLTFDDLTILPGRNYGSADQVELRGRVTRSCEIEVPLLSAAMPAITGAKMAIGMGEFGGLGVIHRFMKIAEQQKLVERVVEYCPDRNTYPQATLNKAGGLLCAASIATGDRCRCSAGHGPALGL